MRYQLKPIFCRSWTLNGLSPRLIERAAVSAMSES
jgi:hypothetical protein